jgi:hypothetical protein
MANAQPPMNASETQSRVVTIAMTIGLAILVCITAILAVNRSIDQAALETLRNTNRTLREQLAAQEQASLGLRASIERLQVATNGLQQLGTMPLELRERLDRLSLIQTQILNSSKNLAVKLGAAESPDEQIKARRASFAALENEANMHNLALAAEQTKMTELAATLAVPADVVGLVPAVALAQPNLKGYWQFFTAKQDVEARLQVAHRLKLRLMAEKVDLRTQEAVRSSP